MRGSKALVISLLVPVVVGFGQCEVHEMDCPDGETRWDCDIQSTPCNMADVVHLCANNVQDAIARGNNLAVIKRKPREPIVGTTCEDTGI